MPATINGVLDTARSQIGYVEGSNNNTKYGAEYGLNYNPWCVMFIWWIFKNTGASDLFYGGGKIALCSALYNYHRNQGQAVSRNSLKSGDIVFFDFSGRGVDTDHVGIVEAANGSTVTTIEGNTSSGSSGSQANGDGVYRRTRSISLISCAYRPAYSGSGSSSSVNNQGGGYMSGYSTRNFVRDVQERIGAGIDGIVGSETMAKVPLLSTSNNKRHPVVRTVQVKLFSLGYKLPTYGADGDFGSETRSAVIAFQAANGLSADGIIGTNTWTKLLNS